MTAGRPRVPGTEAGRTPVFKLPLPDPMRSAILAELARQDRTRRQTTSEWIREAIAEKLNQSSPRAEWQITRDTHTPLISDEDAEAILP